MAPEEAVVDEFEAEAAPVAEDNAKGMTSALVFMTTAVLVIAIVVILVAMKKWYGQGLFA